MVQFDPITYSTMEGQAATMTIVLSEAANEEVTVLFSTEDGSARGNDPVTLFVYSSVVVIS